MLSFPVEHFSYHIWLKCGILLELFITRLLCLDKLREDNMAISFHPVVFFLLLEILEEDAVANKFDDEAPGLPALFSENGHHCFVCSECW